MGDRSGERVFSFSSSSLVSLSETLPRIDSYLVDPASSHMLVSKIKPCTSKYKYICITRLRMAHYISYSLFDG